jgi:uncharacterized SAM-binding protein YcdF (DUF218 family)
MQTHFFLQRIYKIAKIFVFVWGVFSLLLLIISFTNLPFWAIYHLGVSKSEYQFKPNYIVLMSGAAYPSKSALLRTYYTKLAIEKYPNAQLVIALPCDLEDSLNSSVKIQKALTVDTAKTKILFENKGTNTRSQALFIKENLNISLGEKILIITAPENMYRTICTFKKIGYQYLGGLPTFEKNFQISLNFDADKTGVKNWIPNVGKGTQLRYQFWNHWIYEIKILREYTAIIYYKLNDWI